MTDEKKTTEKKQQFCSFCGKAVYEVKKLVSGRNVCICDECIRRMLKYKSPMFC